MLYAPHNSLCQHVRAGLSGAARRSAADEDCVAPGLCDEAMDNLVPCVWCACEDSAAFAEAILDDIEANFCVNTCVPSAQKALTVRIN